LLVVVLEREHALVRAILIGQKLPERVGVLDRRGFYRLETVAFEYGADRFDHAPGSRDLRRPAIGEPARQPRFELGFRHRESNRQVSGFQESGGHVVRARSLRQGDNVPTTAVQSLLNLPPRPRPR
jgi:hypothetical protein